MTGQDLLKLAEELEAQADALEASRDEFLNGIEAALNRLRHVGGLPKRDLRAALKANGRAKPAA